MSEREVLEKQNLTNLTNMIRNFGAGTCDYRPSRVKYSQEDQIFAEKTRFWLGRPGFCQEDQVLV